MLHGSRSYVLCDEHGQVGETPLDLGRARLSGRRARARVPGRDAAAPSTSPVHRRRGARGFHRLCRLEGIIPALESAHALPAAERLARELGPDAIVLVGLSGRGDKDVDASPSGRV